MAYGGKIEVPVTGRTIHFQARTEVDAEAIAGIIRASIAGAYKRAGQIVANLLVSSTLPNTPQSRFLSGGTGRNTPNKKEVTRLKQRIRKTISGKIPDAVPDAKGRPVLAGPNKIRNGSSVPVVTERKLRGRRSRTRRVNKPDRVLNAGEILQYIRDNTYMIAKKKAVTRRMNNYTSLAWTTKADLKQASNALEKRAGNFIFGWNSLAEAVGGRAVKAGTQDGGKYDSPGGTSSLHIDPDNDYMYMDGTNTNVPKFKERYMETVIDANTEKWVDIALDIAFKEIKPSNLKKLKSVQDYEGVTIEWD